MPPSNRQGKRGATVRQVRAMQQYMRGEISYAQMVAICAGAQAATPPSGRVRASRRRGL